MKKLNLPEDEICKLYEDGINSTIISDKYMCSNDTILNILHSNSIKIRTKSETHSSYNNGCYLELPIDNIINDYQNGMSLTALSLYYGCGRNTIMRRLLEQNVDIRPQSYYMNGEDNPNFGIRWSDEKRRIMSANKQHIPYDEWEDFAINSPYCPLFNEGCRESNREKYDRRCFLSGLPESENITKTGKHQKLSVHHVDMNKQQGCDDHRWRLVPLCMACHGSAHSDLWEARITWLLENVWCDECYVW